MVAAVTTSMRTTKVSLGKPLLEKVHWAVVDRLETKLLRDTGFCHVVRKHNLKAEKGKVDATVSKKVLLQMLNFCGSAFGSGKTLHDEAVFGTI